MALGNKLNKSSLGRGLSSLLPEITPSLKDKEFDYIEIDKINTNPFQPRLRIPLDSVMELSESIKEKGVIVPLTVVKSEIEGEYTLVAGERRLQAAKLAGFKEIPAVIRELSKQDIAEIALIENIHRKELNPIEEGYAFLRLNKEFGLSITQIMNKISKKEAYVNDKIKLTSLPKIIQNAISLGEIRESQGLILSELKDEGAMIAALKIVIRDNLSVKKTRELIDEILIQKNQKKTNFIGKQTLEWQIKYKYIRDDLTQNLGYDVKLKKRQKNGGAVIIDFNSDEELESLYKKLRSN